MLILEDLQVYRPIYICTQFLDTLFLWSIVVRVFVFNLIKSQVMCFNCACECSILIKETKSNNFQLKPNEKGLLNIANVLLSVRLSVGRSIPGCLHCIVYLRYLCKIQFHANHFSEDVMCIQMYTNPTIKSP